MELQQKLKMIIRDVPDFPKPGILFKDITPVLSNVSLCQEISETFYSTWKEQQPDAVVGIESRGFIFGMQLAQSLKVPFIPVRKAGKLPYQTIRYSYELEYGSAEMEMHQDAIEQGQRVLIHDDLLATGGTAGAAAELIRMAGGEVQGFSFLVELAFLKGRDHLSTYHKEIQSLVRF